MSQIVLLRFNSQNETISMYVVIFNPYYPIKSWIRLINKHCCLFIYSETRYFKSIISQQ